LILQLNHQLNHLRNQLNNLPANLQVFLPISPLVSLRSNHLGTRRRNLPCSQPVNHLLNRLLAHLVSRL
jgi:hypothetical protein